MADQTQVKVGDSTVQIRVQYSDYSVGVSATGGIVQVPSSAPRTESNIVNFKATEGLPPSAPERQEKPRIAINKVDIRALKGVQGISRPIAVRLLALRPEEGYRDMPQMQSLTAELNINWEELDVEFEF